MPKVSEKKMLAEILNAMFSGEKIIVETTGVKFFNFYKVFFFSIMEWCDEYPQLLMDPAFFCLFSLVSLILLEMICYFEHDADWR